MRIGESVIAASELLRRLYADPRCEFWADSVTYAGADLSGVRGHRQVTNAYLMALVSARGKARLATLDRALAQAHPQSTVLIT